MIQSVSMEAAGVLGRRTARNVSQEQNFTGHLLSLHLADGIDICFPFEDSKHCWFLRLDVSRYMNDSLAHLPAWASAGTPAWRESVQTYHPGSSHSLWTLDLVFLEREACLCFLHHTSCVFSLSAPLLGTYLPPEKQEQLLEGDFSAGILA